MSRADNIRMRIAELEDDIACAESDFDEDGDTSFDMDTARCMIADLKVELAELETPPENSDASSE